MLLGDKFSERLAELRIKKGVSAREMSLSVGQSGSYINNIENKHSLPSMSAFFDICDYLGVTPKEFFDFDEHYPQEFAELISDMKTLNEEQIKLLQGFVKQMKQ